MKKVLMMFKRFSVARNTTNIILMMLVTTLLLIPNLLNDSFVAAQSSDLELIPVTWNVIGLDSNDVTSGPQHFPVGASVCNTSGSDLTNVLVEFFFDNPLSASPYINLRPGTSSSLTLPLIPAGECRDAYFEIEVTRDAAAYDTSREYYIQATAGGEVDTTPQPRELFVEYLISQNRNATTTVNYGIPGDPLTSVPAGGSFSLLVGETYNIQLVGSTATQGYEQLESFLTLSNTIFRINSVSTTYSADTSPYVPSPNPRLYADACLWDNNINSPTYLSCLQSSLKAGGSVTVTYNVTILSGGGTTQTLNSLLYDFSGSSFHYNADFSSGARLANIIDPSNAALAKQFTPSSLSSGGVTTLTFRISNPNGGQVSGYNFSDPLPGDLQVANPPNATTNGCGTPTFSPTAGDTTIFFADGTVAGNSSCTISVSVTGTAITTHNNVTNNLFVGTIDTGESASATLEVNNEPPPPACTPGITVATWDFNDGTTNPSTVNPQISTATASFSGTANSVVANPNTGGSNPTASNVWQGTGWITSTTPAAAGPGPNDGAYFQFELDTSNLIGGALSIAVDGLMFPNGDWAANNNLTVNIHASTDGGVTWTTISNNFDATKGSWENYPLATGGTGEVATPGTGTTIFRITASGRSGSSPNAPFNIDNVVFTGCAVPEYPTLDKAFSPSPIGETGISTLAFTVVNPNPAVSLTGVQFSDTLPTGLQVAATPNASTLNCGTPTWSPTSGDTDLSFISGTIAGGATCTVTVDVTGSVAGAYTNVSNFISSTETGENSTSTGSATATLNIIQSPAIEKVFSPNPVLANQPSTLTFTIINPNTSEGISSVSFTDNFPAGMVVVATPNATNTCGGTFTTGAGANTVNLVNGALTADSSCTLTVDVTASSTGSYVNTSFAVQHVVGGSTYGNVTATDTLDVVPPNPSINILKEVGNSNDAVNGSWFPYLVVPVAGDVYYRMTIENTGDVPLTGVSVSDPTLSGAGVDLSSCSVANLPVADANDDDHIHVCVVGPVTAVAGTNPNQATAISTPPSGPAVNDISDAAIYATGELALDKQASPTIYTTGGETITYTFIVENTGAAILSGPVIINDALIIANCPALSTVGNGDDYFDPAETTICTGTYTTTPADVSNGSVTNTANATAPTNDAPGAPLITSNDDTAVITTPPTGQVTGFVWHDLNGSAIQDGGEPGLENYTVELVNANDDSVVSSVLTDPGGLYSFTSLPAGDYYVRVTPLAPIDNLVSQDMGGDDNIDSDFGIDIATSTFVTSPFTLASDGTVDFDAGFYELSVASGTIFNDDDVDVVGDGIFNGADTGISSIDVTLSGTNGTGFPISQTVSTDVNGFYEFDAVPPGNYTIIYTDPATLFSVTDTEGIANDNSIAIAPTSGSSLTDNNFLDDERTISGTVRYDEDNDANNTDTGEIGVAGVTVDLSGDATASVVTDASGNYVFIGVPAGNFTITETNPAGLVSTTDSDGTNDDIIAVTLVATDATTANNDFWDVGNTTVSGQVRYDSDADGDFADPDTGLAGVTVTIELDVDNNGIRDGVFLNTVTDATGNYVFTNIPEGTHRITETNPADYSISTADGDGSGNGDDTIDVIVAAGVPSTDNNFLDSGNSTVEGQVRLDLDADGDLTEGTPDPGISGVTITIDLDIDNDGTPDGTLLTTVTDGSGNYSFANLPQGTHLLTETNPAGFSDSTDADLVNDNTLTVTLVANTTVSNQDFVDLSNASISGSVIDDVNGDGALDGGDGTLDGITIGLFNTSGNPILDSDGNPITTVTTGGGVYIFSNVPPDDYLIRETQPAGYQSTNDADGGANSFDEIAITVTAGTTITDQNFFDQLIVPTIGVAKSASTPVDNADGTFTTTITLTVENLGPEGLNNVQVSDDLTTEFGTFVGATPTNAGEYTVSNMNTGMFTAATIAFDGAVNQALLSGTDSLGMGATGTITFDLTFYPNTSSYTNQAVASGAGATSGTSTSDTSDNGTDPDPDGDNNPDEAGENDATPITITVTPTIGVAKSAGTPVDNADGTFTTTITLTVENLGPEGLNNVQISDDLITEFGTFVGATPTNAGEYTVTNMNTGTFTAPATAFDGAVNQALLSGTDSLGIGVTGTITFDLTFYPNTSSYTNQAVASGAGATSGTSTSDTSDNGTDPDPDGDNNPDEAGENDATPITLNPSADVGITKTDNVDPVVVGNNVIYTITVTNNGPDTATDVTVSDTFTDAAVTPVSISSSQGGCTAFPCNLGSITNTASATITVEVTADAAGTITNTAIVTSTTTDPDNSNDEAIETTTVSAVPVPSINVSKQDALFNDVDSNSLVDVGDMIRYTVRLTNNGTADALDVFFDDTLDANTALVVGSVITSQGTVITGNTAGDTNITVDLGTVVQSTTVTITYDVVVQPTTAISVANQGLVTGSNVNDTPTNDPDTPTDDDPTSTSINQPLPPVTEEPDVTESPDVVILVFDPAVSKVGFLQAGELGLQNEKIKWFVTVINNGSATGTNIVVTDTLHPELRVDGVNVPQPLTSVINGQTVTVLVPSLAPGQSYTFEIETTVISGGEEIDNTVCLTADGLDSDLCATASAIDTLPETGEGVWWRNLLILFVTVFSLVIGGGISRAFIKHNRA